MLSVSNEELKNMQNVKSGDVFLCPRCKKLHEMKPAIKDGKPDESLLWFSCEGSTFLGAVNGKNLWT